MKQQLPSQAQKSPEVTGQQRGCCSVSIKAEEKHTFTEFTEDQYKILDDIWGKVELHEQLYRENMRLYGEWREDEYKKTANKNKILAQEFEAQHELEKEKFQNQNKSQMGKQNSLSDRLKTAQDQLRRNPSPENIIRAGNAVDAVNGFTRLPADYEIQKVEED